MRTGKTMIQLLLFAPDYSGLLYFLDS